jgi:hypothetical protein
MIKITNDRPESFVVSLEEQLIGDWTVVSESQKGAKRDSMTYYFEIQAPSAVSADLEDSVRFKW